jgi:hypothetical protein
MGYATSSRRFGQAGLQCPFKRRGRGLLDALLRPRGGGGPLSRPCMCEVGKKMTNLHATQANDGTKIAIRVKIAQENILPQCPVACSESFLVRSFSRR